MIVNLNLENKKIIIIGGGSEAQKRINSVLEQGCDVTVISKKTSTQINKLARDKKIKLEKLDITDTKFISKYKPDIIITTTDDSELNQNIIDDAKRNKIMVYSSGNPRDSDFANPAILDLEDIQIAIFTGGQSPAVAKKIKDKAEKFFRETITINDIAQIRIQDMARKILKDTVPTQRRRKECLHSILQDTKIAQLIRDGHIEKAEKRASTISRNWR